LALCGSNQIPGKPGNRFKVCKKKGGGLVFSGMCRTTSYIKKSKIINLLNYAFQDSKNSVEFRREFPDAAVSNKVVKIIKKKTFPEVCESWYF